MSTIMPKGESLRKAVKWISQEKQDNPEKKTNALINEAGLRFNLNPNEAEYLMRFYKKNNK